MTKIWRNGPSGGCLGRDKRRVETHTFKVQFGENLVLLLKRSSRSLTGRAVSAATGVSSLGSISQGKRAAFLSQTLHSTIRITLL